MKQDEKNLNLTPPVGFADSPLSEGVFKFAPEASLSRVAAVGGGCHVVTGGVVFDFVYILIFRPPVYHFARICQAVYDTR